MDKSYEDSSDRISVAVCIPIMFSERLRVGEVELRDAERATGDAVFGAL